MVKSEIFSIIKRAFENQKMFESILFETSDQQVLEETVNQVVHFLYCQNHSFINDECENCKKFNQQKILDYLRVGDGYLAINKESLKKVLDEFSTTAKCFGQPKVLVIANAENLKIDAANTLLKFLEEPTPNTFLFLLTRNRNDVLPTIKSRTKIFAIDFERKNNEATFLVKIIQSQKKDNLLLLNNKLKKMKKEELIILLQQTLNHFLESQNLKVYEEILVLINDLKFNVNPNLAIDRFLIEIVGEF